MTLERRLGALEAALEGAAAARDPDPPFQFALCADVAAADAAAAAGRYVFTLDLGMSREPLEDA